MKYPLVIPFAFVCTFAFVAFSQESLEKPAKSTDSKTQILGEISDGGKLTDKSPKSEPIDFAVIKSRTEKVLVKETPEMPGLPAPQGTMNLKVELVQKPHLEDLVPLPLLEANDPAVLARVNEISNEHPDTKLLLVSATVYNHSFTHFRIHSHEKGAKVISGWSNINFNHFSGFASYQVKGADGILRTYGYVMAISDMDKPEASANAPRLPHLSNGPAFILSEGDINDPQAKQLAEDIHNLYKVEGKRMEEAYRKRTREYEARKAYLLANPPKPRDVTIRFWNRDGSNAR